MISSLSLALYCMKRACVFVRNSAGNVFDKWLYENWSELFIRVFLLLLCFVPILQCPDRILLLLLALSLSRYNQTKLYYVALIFEALNSKNSIQKRHIELMVCALAWMDFAHTRTLYRHIFFCFFVSVRPPNIQRDGCCFMANTHTHHSRLSGLDLWIGRAHTGTLNVYFYVKGHGWYIPMSVNGDDDNSVHSHTHTHTSYIYNWNIYQTMTVIFCCYFCQPIMGARDQENVVSLEGMCLWVECRKCADFVWLLVLCVMSNVRIFDIRLASKLNKRIH